MKNILLAVTMILFITIIIPMTAFAEQDKIILINEVETNPPGIDSGGAKEYVELYNPSENDVDIGGWILSPSKFSYKSYTIPENTVISKHGFLVLTHVGFWFSDSGDSLDLINTLGELVDSSPELQDLENNMMTWQRITDGFDSDSDSDWVMKLSTPNSSNGKIQVIDEDPTIAVSVVLEKENFNFDEIVNISGYVSKEVFVEKPTFFQEPILITISNQNGFSSNFHLYPDNDLRYSVPLKIQKVLGIDEGNYVITVDYAGSSTSTQFTVFSNEKTIDDADEFQLTFDVTKESYIPGETIIFSGNVNEIKPISQISLEIFDSNGVLFTSGNVFPNASGELHFEVFLPTVNMPFGKYVVDVSFLESNQYGYQSKTVDYSTSFLVIEDFVDDEIISFSTNKSVYGLGEPISIVGRSNSYWVPSLDLNVIQTGTHAFYTDPTDDISGTDPFKHNGVVRLNGDGTFTYDLKIPNISDRLGDYKITISKSFGTKSLNFVISDDPENYVLDERPFVFQIDKESYLPNETIKMSGKIADLQKRFGVLSSVNIDFFNSQGNQINIKACLGDNNDECETFVPFTLTSSPDLAGRYDNSAILFTKIFEPGKYSVRASFEEFDEFKTFEVIETDTKIDAVESTTPITLTLDKTVYYVGDTLNISGFVVPKKIHTDSDDLSTSSEHTDFRLAQNNQVRLFIPYPLYLTTVHDASVTTTTDDEYTGGGVQGTDAGKGSYNGVITYNKSIQLLDGFESNILPDVNGEFSTSFKLRAGVFSDGEYLVRATYHGNHVDIPIRIIDNSLSGGKNPVLKVSTDKIKYIPGETVKIVGAIENIYYFDSVELTVKNEAQTKQNCLKMNCGLGNNVKKIRINESTETFSSTYEIPDGVQSLGKYQIIVKTHFDTIIHEFEVTESLPVMTDSEDSGLKKIIDKVSRISESSIEILLNKKIVGNDSLSPRVLQGSLFTPIRGAESDVNLKLVTNSGICVIGQDTSCLISDSTRAPGKIFEIIQLDGKSYKVRYSGADAKLEKFSILPEDDSEVLQKSSWNVVISKDGQPSKFYYKISYLKTE